MHQLKNNEKNENRIGKNEKPNETNEKDDAGADEYLEISDDVMCELIIAFLYALDESPRS